MIYGRIKNSNLENNTDHDQAERIFRALQLIENSRSLSFEYANHVKSAWINSFSGIESESPDACHDMKCAVDYFCPRVFNNVLDVTMYSVRKIQGYKLIFGVILIIGGEMTQVLYLFSKIYRFEFKK